MKQPHGDKAGLIALIAILALFGYTLSTVSCTNVEVHVYGEKG